MTIKVLDFKEALKGGKSEYELDRIKRGAWSRLRKVEFNLKQISFIKIDDSVLVKCGSFQRDFRNSNGTPRMEKVLLDLEKLDEEIVFFLDALQFRLQSSKNFPKEIFLDFNSNPKTQKNPLK